MTRDTSLLVVVTREGVLETAVAVAVETVLAVTMVVIAVTVYPLTKRVIIV